MVSRCNHHRQKKVSRLAACPAAAWQPGREARKQAWVKTAVHCMNEIVVSVSARKIAHRCQQIQQAFTRVRDASWRATFNCVNFRGVQPSGTRRQQRPRARLRGSAFEPEALSLSTDLWRRARTSPELLRRPLPSLDAGHGPSEFPRRDILSRQFTLTDMTLAAVRRRHRQLPPNRTNRRNEYRRAPGSSPGTGLPGLLCTSAGPRRCL
jgi:hypothetical protein